MWSAAARGEKSQNKTSYKRPLFAEHARENGEKTPVVVFSKEEETGNTNDDSKGAGAQPFGSANAIVAVVAIAVTVSGSLTAVLHKAIGDAARVGSSTTTGVGVRVGTARAGAAIVNAGGVSGPDNTTARNSVNSGSLGGAAGLSGFTLVHVFPCAEEALENGRLVAVDDGVVGSPDVIVVVRDTLVGARGLVRLPALDLDLSEGGKVVAILLDLIRVPVDLSTSPINGALGVGLETTGPDGDLNTGWRLGEIPLLSFGVPSLGSLLDTANLSIDKPPNFVWGPLDLIVVEFAVRIIHSQVTGIAV